VLSFCPPRNIFDKFQTAAELCLKYADTNRDGKVSKAEYIKWATDPEQRKLFKGINHFFSCTTSTSFQSHSFLSFLDRANHRNVEQRTQNIKFRIAAIYFHLSQSGKCLKTIQMIGCCNASLVSLTLNKEM
jgi:hypothetical protein